MSEYLYRIQPTRPEMLSQGPSPEEGRLIGEHFAYLQDLVARGVVSFAGRTMDPDADAFGLVVFEACDEETALGIMQADPAVAAGVMQARLFPFKSILKASPSVQA